MTNLTITRPDDWHIHLRDGAVLSTTVADAARYMGRVLVMPNLTPPVRTADEASAYRARIMAAQPATRQVEPVMTLYLTDNTDPEALRQAHASGAALACKLYPAGATTNSDAGVTDINKVMGCLEVMAEIGMPLLVHGEVTREAIDIFDREAVFIDEILQPLTERLPQLKVVLEHITTAQAAEFVGGSNANVAATITAHHLLYNRNHMLVGGVRPHLFCLPILKRNVHQQALIEAATSGNPKFFLGTDSAPHSQHKKEAACGCAGCYTGHAAIELYAEAFEAAGALDKLEAFASFHGPDFYGLPRNRDTITLTREEWAVPAHYPFGGEALIPLRAGEAIHWRVLPA